jgi:hypothetical protein
MQKKIILSLIIAGTMGLTYLLIQYMDMQSFSFAWTLNFLLMMCVLMFTETLKSPLTSPYYNQKGWENGGKVYESFGIHAFRKLLVWTGWEKLNKKANPVEKNFDSLIQLHYKTKQSELGHILIFIIVFGFTLFVAYKYGFLNSLWLLSLNIVLNLYPIFLQRYNRPRLARAIHLSKSLVFS